MSICLVLAFIVVVTLTQFTEHDIVRIDDMELDINGRLGEIMSVENNDTYGVQVIASFARSHKIITIPATKLTFIQNFNQINPHDLKLNDYILWNNSIGEIKSLLNDGTYTTKLLQTNMSVDISANKLTFLPQFKFVEYRMESGSRSISMFFSLLDGGMSSKHLNSFIITDSFSASMIEDNALSFLPSPRSKYLHGFPRIIGLKFNDVKDCIMKCRSRYRSVTGIISANEDLAILGLLSSSDLEQVIENGNFKQQIKRLGKKFIALIKKVHPSIRLLGIRSFIRCIHAEATFTDIGGTQLHRTQYMKKVHEREVFIKLVMDYYTEIADVDLANFKYLLHEIKIRLDAGINPNFIVMFVCGEDSMGGYNSDRLKQSNMTRDEIKLQFLKGRLFKFESNEIPVRFLQQISIQTNSHNDKRRCNNCGKRDVTLLKCAGCKKVYYCNSDCQRNDGNHSCSHRGK